MKKDKNNSLVYMTYILRFAQISFGFGILQGIFTIYISTLIGVSTSLIFVSLFAYSFVLENKLKKTVQEEVTTQANELCRVKKDMFLEAPMPVIVLDKLGNIVWNNKSFQAMIGEGEVLEKNIRSIFADIQIESLPKDDEVYMRLVEKNEKRYEMICQKVSFDEIEIDFNYTAYFVDVSKEKLLEEKVKQQQCMLGYLYIDNYEEIMQSTEEVRRPMLGAIIDRKIGIWFKNNDVGLCKFDRDRYMLFFTEQSLQSMQQRKFDILDELRHIQVGNDLPVTVSIGIGRNFTSLGQSKEDARAAFDLALGRGGDQAIIKTHDKYTFYGGKTKEVEKSTRVKVRIKAYAFKELLHDADKVYIMGHKNIDVDCLGAAMGVYRAATIMGKKAQIILGESNFAVQGIYDRIIATPEYKDIFITTEKADQEITKQTLLVLVDAHRRSQLEYPELLDKTENVVVFDHHRLSTDFIEDAVLTYIEPFISSTCEMISEILNYLTDKVKLTQIEADALLAGITIDTKNFVFKTGVRTFEAAAFLRRAGADSTRVRMLFQNDLDTYRIKATAIKNVEMWQEGIVITAVEGEYSNNNILAAQVADELLNIKEIQAAFVVARNGDDLLVSARSIEDTNVQRIMEMLGGGGHRNIAGAQLRGMTIEEAKLKIKEAITEYQEEGE
ncbi:MAG: DHH family phosphoesterase [Cellulosilyticaceae bacterium]